MLELRNVTKTFAKGTVNEHTALKHVSLTLKDDDFITILGSNGAGKSTLFGAIAGTFYVDEGEIILDGKHLEGLPEHKRARMVGTLFQDPMKGTAPDLTIEENLSLACNQTRRFPLALAVQKRDLAYYREQLSAFRMGLEDRMKMKVGLLSGGQRQALTLLMATLRKPQLLLLDEHTAALDPKTAAKVMEVTRLLVNQDRLTTLMITHNMRDAIEYGDRLIMMYSGRIVVDVAGEEKKNLTVEQLLNLFSQASGSDEVDDKLVLS